MGSPKDQQVGLVLILSFWKESFLNLNQNSITCFEKDIEGQDIEP